MAWAIWSMPAFCSWAEATILQGRMVSSDIERAGEFLKPKPAIT
jgi:hypothetical protein